MKPRAVWARAVLAGVATALLPLLTVAAPNATFTAHRGAPGSNLPAPLFVHFDATATTSSIAGDRPVADLLFEWNFGDAAAGTWATTGLSKNRAFGIVAAHVFDRAGTYTVTLTVTDRQGARTTATRTVEVVNPDTFWSGTKTACVSASGNFADCPVGASQLRSGDFRAAMNDRVGAGARRILLRRGETFVSNDSWGTPQGATEALVGGFGGVPTDKPIIQITAQNTFAAVVLAGNSRSTASTRGWRFVGLRLASASTSAQGFATSFLVGDMLLYGNDIGPLPRAFNVNIDDSGLDVSHPYLGIVDNQLRGNDGTITAQGTCLFGGAQPFFVAGNVCGQTNVWPFRLGYVAKGVFQHNVISKAAGAYEGVKFHCSQGGDNSTAICRYLVASDNMAASRINVVTGGRDEGTIQDSLFERNRVTSGGFQIQNPNDIFRHNVVASISIFDRIAYDPGQPRGTIIENNTCANSDQPCVIIGANSNATRVDGLLLRNNLHFKRNSAIPFMSENSTAGGAITQQGNVSTATNPFVSATPNNLVSSNFALTTASGLIDKGVAGGPRTIDLLGNPVPGGASVDVGAVEAGSGSPVAVDQPPAPPVLLSVDVTP